MNIVEAFSGIGSQAKALENLRKKNKTNYDYNIINIVEWDINAICAYDLIHNGSRENDIKKFSNYSKNELVEKLSKFQLSSDSKNPIIYSNLKRMNLETLKNVLCAIQRTNNLCSITDIRGDDLADNTDLLTYSFPCQDLSNANSWHGNTTGIDRGANNRSGMLWEIERILHEKSEARKPLPRFLLMENVSNINRGKHKQNFLEWQDQLKNLGYYNKIYTLNAMSFGIPQRRTRTFMISVLVQDKINLRDKVQNYFEHNNLENKKEKLKPLKNFLRIDYSNYLYKSEADNSNPNDTPSRRVIFDNNPHLYKGKNEFAEVARTITTKQDRNPNAGVVFYKEGPKGKSNYRNLTPRECFLLMGFTESDFDIILKNNFAVSSKDLFFTRDKLTRFAGNSIVVPILESIFEQIFYINNNIFNNK